MVAAAEPIEREEGERRHADATRARFDVCMAAVRECEYRKGRMRMHAEIDAYLRSIGQAGIALAVRTRCTT